MRFEIGEKVLKMIEQHSRWTFRDIPFANGLTVILVILSLWHFSNGTNTRVESVNERIDGTNTRLDETNKRIDETNTRLDETNKRIDETNTRLDVALMRLTELTGIQQETRSSLKKYQNDLDEVVKRQGRLETEIQLISGE